MEIRDILRAKQEKVLNELYYLLAKMELENGLLVKKDKDKAG